jgi:hypothetical protein
MNILSGINHWLKGGVLCFLIITTGCKTLKSYETFFVGEQGTQYFIKPIPFKNEAGEKAELDFSFRYRSEVKDSVTINMTFYNKDLIKSIDSCRLSNDVLSFKLRSLSLLFLEREGKTNNLRYSGKASLADVTKLFGQEKWTIMVHFPKSSAKYLPSSKTSKKIKSLNHNIFSLF